MAFSFPTHFCYILSERLSYKQNYLSNLILVNVWILVLAKKKTQINLMPVITLFERVRVTRLMLHNGQEADTTLMQK